MCLSSINVSSLDTEDKVGIASRSPYTGWPKKVSHFQIIKKLYLIVLKLVNEI